jgi:hypothetical protein
VQHQGAGLDQAAAVLEHGFDLGEEGVVDLQGLGGPEGGLGQQRPGRGDGVDNVGLGQAAGPSLLGAALGGDLADVQPGGSERDRDVLAPARCAFDTNPVDTMRGEKLDSFEVAGAPVREGHCDELDAVAVHDADGEGVLVRVDPRDGACHAEGLLLDVMLRWVRDGRSASAHPSQVEQAPFKPGALLPALHPARQV